MPRVKGNWPGRPSADSGVQPARSSGVRAWCTAAIVLSVWNPYPRAARLNPYGCHVNISELFIRRPIATSLLMAGIALFGVVAYRGLPVADLPTVDYPTV